MPCLACGFGDVKGGEIGDNLELAFPNGGVVAIFVGQITPLNAQQRRQGVLDELADAKDVTGPQLGKYRLYGDGGSTNPFLDDTNATRAQENARNVLVALKDEPNVCTIGLWAYNPPAILSAVRDKDLLGKIKIVGFDENDETLQGIERVTVDDVQRVAADLFKNGSLAATVLGNVNGLKIPPERLNLD